MTDADQVALYPRYCFDLSPTVNTWCFLRSTEIHALQQHDGFEGENFYFYKNLPVKWVRMVGVVVGIDENAGRRFYTVDDSSGKTIQALISLPAAATAEDAAAASQEKGQKNAILTNTTASFAPEPYPDIEIGSVVDVKGGISMFRNERQINVEKMALLRTTAQEVVLWEKRAKFYREVLLVPWVLRKRDIRQCRKEAELSEAEAAKKKKRVKAITTGEKEAHGEETQIRRPMEAPRPRRQELRDQQHQQHQQRPPGSLYAVKPMVPTRTRQAGETNAAVAENIQRIIQEGAAKGMYSALGL